MNRIHKPTFRRIFTGDENLERIQDNIESTINSKSDLFFGTPTELYQENTIAKFGDIVLCNPIRGSFFINLQKSDRKDIGKFIIIKNISSLTNDIKIVPYKNGYIDNQTSFTMDEAYQSILLMCVNVNIWERI